MEFIQTIQGEGINVGKPVILVRFDGCNLRCSFCDTKQASLSEKETSFEVITNRINNLKQYFPNITTLLITGGEPLYNKHFIHVIKTQQDMGFEIETNGTLLKNIFEFEKDYAYFRGELQLNISPKFDLVSHGPEVTCIGNVFSIYKEQFKFMMDTGFNNYTVKFVYGTYMKNCEEIILSFIIANNIPKKKVVLMPFTPDKTDFKLPSDFLASFNENAKRTILLCLKHGFRYSPREHITLGVK